MPIWLVKTTSWGGGRGGQRVWEGGRGGAEGLGGGCGVLGGEQRGFGGSGVPYSRRFGVVSAFWGFLGRESWGGRNKVRGGGQCKAPPPPSQPYRTSSPLPPPPHHKIPPIVGACGEYPPRFGGDEGPIQIKGSNLRAGGGRELMGGGGTKRDPPRRKRASPPPPKWENCTPERTWELGWTPGGVKTRRGPCCCQGSPGGSSDVGGSFNLGGRCDVRGSSDVGGSSSDVGEGLRGRLGVRGFWGGSAKRSSRG